MWYSAAVERAEGGGSRPIRQRADVLVVEQGLASSRQKAQALILAGEIWLDQRRIDKPGQQVPVDAVLSLRSRARRFVSRGGEKLDGALVPLGLDPEGMLCWDIGASTGGFTDCLLRHGARHVVAVDVGHGQLDDSLRKDERVTLQEGINARYLQAGQLPGPPGLVVVDVSFISLEKVLPALSAAAPDAPFLVLVKPQFEAGRSQVGRGGVVRDPVIQMDALRRVARAAKSLGRGVAGVMESPLPGAEGNREYFLRLDPMAGMGPEDPDLAIQEIIHGCGTKDED